ncbi:L-ribulokinase [Arboricoccus pini]|uniref:L-ribulokinase n=1 Tax=Arboricoccus pini TaxID=1963835 RepID=A0A212RZ57_9PROT|nr:ribulokinase [Arboricoccus pini]SNB78143.1 L-ribulokinase [Arboricoccus pini]
MTEKAYAIGLDFGSESARGVLLDLKTGQIAHRAMHAYRHGIMSERLPDGSRLGPAWALQCASDYVEAAQILLEALGSGRQIIGIGIDFTASSPLPARLDGTPLSDLHPERPHAYVKLWKHRAAQFHADAINARGGDFLRDCGGRVSAEWLLPKAAQLAAEDPDLWDMTERFIEAGDWLVWQLTGQEGRSLSFATFKAQYHEGEGYPVHVVPGLADRLAPPLPIGQAVGGLTAAWRQRTGLRGPCLVAAAVIDSHVVMPAVGATRPGTLVGALGTSAAFLLLDREPRPLPHGIEGMAKDGMLPGFFAYESGMAAFGDTLAWFVRHFPKGGSTADAFIAHGEAAAALPPGGSGLVALDWWAGCRVPHADSRLSGLLLGLTLQTGPAEIYRALMEALAFGARTIRDALQDGGVPVGRIVLTSGLAGRNPFLMQLMADVLAAPVHVPDLVEATALAAAIHGAVAGGVVEDFAAAADRFGATRFATYEPNEAASSVYGDLFAHYRTLSGDSSLRAIMHSLAPG